MLTKFNDNVSLLLLSLLLKRRYQPVTQQATRRQRTNDVTAANELSYDCLWPVCDAVYWLETREWPRRLTDEFDWHSSTSRLHEHRSSLTDGDWLVRYDDLSKQARTGDWASTVCACPAPPINSIATAARLHARRTSVYTLTLSTHSAGPTSHSH